MTPKPRVSQYKYQLCNQESNRNVGRLAQLVAMTCQLHHIPTELSIPTLSSTSTTVQIVPSPQSGYSKSESYDDDKPLPS
jgi:hypothetical protein